MLHQPRVSVPAGSCVAGDTDCMQTCWLCALQVEHLFCNHLPARPRLLLHAIWCTLLASLKCTACFSMYLSYQLKLSK